MPPPLQTYLVDFTPVSRAWTTERSPPTSRIGEGRREPIRHLPRHDGRCRLWRGRRRFAVHHPVHQQGVRVRDGARRPRSRVPPDEGRRRAQRRCLQQHQSRSPNRCAAQSDDQCGCNHDDEPGRRATPSERSGNASRSSIAAFAGRELAVDEAVYRSESETGFRNRAIAWMLKNFGIVEGEPMATLENYFRQCSILVNCRDLAYMAATLANDGVHPSTGKRAMPAGDAEEVLSVMATCGMYDYAGSWLHDVGMPAKSGVGGGIIAVVPGPLRRRHLSRRRSTPKATACGGSPHAGECRAISGLHVFTRTSSPSMALGPRLYRRRSRRRGVGARRTSEPCLRERAHRIKYLCLHGFLGLDGAEYIVRRMGAWRPRRRASSSTCTRRSDVGKRRAPPQHGAARVRRAGHCRRVLAGARAGRDRIR